MFPLVENEDGTLRELIVLPVPPRSDAEIDYEMRRGVGPAQRWTDLPIYADQVADFKRRRNEERDARAHESTERALFYAIPREASDG